MYKDFRVEMQKKLGSPHKVKCAACQCPPCSNADCGERPTEPLRAPYCIRNKQERETYLCLRCRQAKQCQRCLRYKKMEDFDRYTSGRQNWKPICRTCILPSGQNKRRYECSTCKEHLPYTAFRENMRRSIATATHLQCADCECPPCSNPACRAVPAEPLQSPHCIRSKEERQSYLCPQCRKDGWTCAQCKKHKAKTCFRTSQSHQGAERRVCIDCQEPVCSEPSCNQRKPFVARRTYRQEPDTWYCGPTCTSCKTWKCRMHFAKYAARQLHQACLQCEHPSCAKCGAHHDHGKRPVKPSTLLNGRWLCEKCKC